jgi:hypothetical protein
MIPSWPPNFAQQGDGPAFVREGTTRATRRAHKGHNDHSSFSSRLTRTIGVVTTGGWGEAKQPSCAAKRVIMNHRLRRAARGKNSRATLRRRKGLGPDIDWFRVSSNPFRIVFVIFFLRGSSRTGPDTAEVTRKVYGCVIHRLTLPRRFDETSSGRSVFVDQDDDDGLGRIRRRKKVRSTDS